MLVEYGQRQLNLTTSPRIRSAPAVSRVGFRSSKISWLLARIVWKTGGPPRRGRLRRRIGDPVSTA